MFENRLKAARAASGFSQRALAARLHITQQAYASYETGKSTPNPEMLSRIASLFHVSVSYLLGETDLLASSDFSALSRTQIPVYGRVAAGIPIEAVEDVIDMEEISADMARNGEYIALQIHGDSMEPRIREGDVVIVRLQDDAETGDTAVVMVNGTDATCKKIKKTPDGIMLISTNPAYEPMYYTNAEISSLPVRILGRVVELRAKF